MTKENKKKEMRGGSGAYKILHMSGGAGNSTGNPQLLEKLK